MKNDAILFPVVKDGSALRIILDSSDYEGIRLAAGSFANDVYMVSGIQPEICSDHPGSSIDGFEPVALIAGSVGRNNIIAALSETGRLDLAAVRNKRETYTTAVIEAPIPGISRAIVVAGSDKRGTVYGIYRLSELIGVSPWVWWADVLPQQRDTLLLAEADLTYTSKEPSVTYRGFFINDEWPSFGTWTGRHFGGFNEKVYAHIFELILRLKGNFLWPAMWNSVFSNDGQRCPLANAELANAYGIVMGTSHHEPMFRAGEEWQRSYASYGCDNVWNFRRNRSAITRFWQDGVKRNKAYENVVTLGMRGERDSSLEGSIDDNIHLLKDVITVQKQLLAADGLSDCPKVLTLYKEVEDFWYGAGTGNVRGLADWQPLADVTIMLCDDNFGNVRTLPKQAERNRPAGWGMYYHVDYHGAPNSYEWINTVQLEKIWEQMSMAYDYGVRSIWVLNVGDLKPMELPLSYFLDLAYDFDRYGTKAPNTCRNYLEQWVRQQFSAAFPAEADRTRIANILASYTKLNTFCKPEITYPETFSEANDMNRIRTLCGNCMNEATTYYERTPERWKDAFFELVYFPAVASANVKLMNIAAQTGNAVDTKRAIEKDLQLTCEYNQKLAGGKWDGMMSSFHIGYTHWDSEGWKYPTVGISVRNRNSKSKWLMENIPEDVFEHIPPLTFIERGGIISIEASHTTARSEQNGVCWYTLDNYGRTSSAVKMYPDTISFPGSGQGPYLAYNLYISVGGTYMMTIYTAPTNNLLPGSHIRLGYSCDGCGFSVVDTLPDGFRVDIFNSDWSRGVRENCRKTTILLQFAIGVHMLRLYGMDAGIVLEKIVISTLDIRDTSYFGPPESRCS